MKDYGKLVRRVHDSYNIKTGVLFFPASAALPLHPYHTYVLSLLSASKSAWLIMQRVAIRRFLQHEFYLL